MREGPEAEAPRKRAEAEAAALAISIAELQTRYDEQAANVAVRQHHLRSEPERELVARRAERLVFEVRTEEATLARKCDELPAIKAQLA